MTGPKNEVASKIQSQGELKMTNDVPEKAYPSLRLMPSPDASVQAKRDKGRELFAGLASIPLFPIDLQPLPLPQDSSSFKKPEK